MPLWPGAAPAATKRQEIRAILARIDGEVVPTEGKTLSAAIYAFAERFDRRFWRILNEPTSDDSYVSRQEAQQWQMEIAALVATAIKADRAKP
jgi:hypothetical protein